MVYKFKLCWKGLRWAQVGSIGVKMVQGAQDGQGLSETLIEKLNKKLNGRLDDRLWLDEGWMAGFMTDCICGCQFSPQNSVIAARLQDTFCVSTAHMALILLSSPTFQLCRLVSRFIYKYQCLYPHICMDWILRGRHSFMFCYLQLFLTLLQYLCREVWWNEQY